MFTPAEAEAITGVDVGLQRKWRQDGHLPKSEAPGWTRWSPLDVALMLALGRLARLVGPTQATAMLARDSSKTSLASLIYFAAQAEPGATIGVQLAHQPELPPYAVSVGGGPVMFESAITPELFATAEPVIVLNVRELGKILAQRAGRPLHTSIEEPD